MNHDHEPAPELSAADDARVTEALGALGTIEPPDTFTGQVMWRVSSLPVGNMDSRPAGRTGVRMTTAKKALIGLVGIAAAGLVAVYVTGTYPVSQTEGTIGAAQRYQSGQISASDVKVGDPARGRTVYAGKGGCATCHRSTKWQRKEST